ncbi:MAG: single-stranded DNA-binding protein [Myxococcota bacterium]
MTESPAIRLRDLDRALSDELAALRFGPPVTHVYDPLQYARGPHEQYLARCGDARGRLVLVGMNPGPFGMAQTGVPFGEVSAVRDWMGLDAPIGRPDPEHPKRPVLGFEQPRTEVSGQRLWGWARERYGTPEAFFARWFVLNWCPLCVLGDTGRNLTPDKLRARERKPLTVACDRALRRAVEILAPARVIGVGAFAEERARAALDGLDVPVGRVLHPSPASPQANGGWAEKAEAELRAQGVTLP